MAENVLQVSQRQVGFGLHRLHDAYLSTTGRLVLKMTTKKEKFFFKRIENLTFFFMKSANFYNSTERTQQCCEQRFGDSGEEEHS